MRLATPILTSLLDTPPEPEFETVVRIAQRTFHSKIALISLLDEDRQWFKAKCGLSVDETPMEQSFCAHAVAANELFVIPDTLADERFSANPMVRGLPFIRFYAGMPIYVAGEPNDCASVAIGTLCVIDDKPRSFSADDAALLRNLASMAEACIRARAAAQAATRLAEDRQVDLVRMNREQMQFRQAERMADIGSWRLSLPDQLVEWSTQVFAIHDLPVGITPALESALDFYPPQAKPVIATAVQQTISTGDPFDLETDLVTAKGKTKRVRMMGEVEKIRGESVGLVGVFQDITVQHEMAQILRRSASIDELTQIANRAGCNAAIERRYNDVRARGGTAALMLIDLDGFKAINDRYGHQRGDQVLQFVAARLQAADLSDCFVGRFGGDEFIVLTEPTERKFDAVEMVHRLLADLRQRVGFESGGLPVSGTIGLSWLDESVDGTGDWVRRADSALYWAKRKKRGTANVYGRPDIIDIDSASPYGSLAFVSA